jgi:hypothetical protein
MDSLEAVANSLAEHNGSHHQPLFLLGSSHDTLGVLDA